MCYEIRTKNTILQLNAAIDDPERVEGDMIAFTDEEGYGKFMDLNLQYQKYINLKGVKVSASSFC